LERPAHAVQENRGARRLALRLEQQAREVDVVLRRELYEAGEWLRLAPFQRHRFSFVRWTPPSQASGSLTAQSSTSPLSTFSPAGVMLKIVFGALPVITISGTGRDASSRSVAITCASPKPNRVGSVSTCGKRATKSSAPAERIDRMRCSIAPRPFSVDGNRDACSVRPSRRNGKSIESRPISAFNATGSGAV